MWISVEFLTLKFLSRLSFPCRWSMLKKHHHQWLAPWSIDLWSPNIETKIGSFFLSIFHFCYHLHLRYIQLLLHRMLWKNNNGNLPPIIKKKRALHLVIVIMIITIVYLFQRCIWYLPPYHQDFNFENHDNRLHQWRVCILSSWE